MQPSDIGSSVAAARALVCPAKAPVKAMMPAKTDIVNFFTNLFFIKLLLFLAYFVT